MDTLIDDLENLEAGEALPDQPITEGQRQWVYNLVSTCTYTDEQKQGIINTIDCNITYDEAASIIADLLANQFNPLDLQRNGNQLLTTDLKKAIRKAVEQPNT